jgi:phage terminase small subunit
MNATQAAIRAGYGKAGAATQGSLLLKQEKIQLRISEINKKRMKRLNINADSVVKEIALIAFSNIGNIASWTNSQVTLKESTRLTSEQKAGIQSVEEKISRYGSSVKVKMYDKPQALVLLCRYLNILDGNANVTDPADTAKKLKDAYLAMFASVPDQPKDPNSLDEVKNGPVREYMPEPGKTATSKPIPDTERLQKPLPFSDPKPEDYEMED